MRSLPEVVAELGLQGEAEVLRWVEAACLRPEPGEGYRFRAIDVARLRLIRELDRDLAVDAEAIPVVLDLLDQVYDLRRRVRALADALALEDEAVRRRVLERCRAGLAEPG
jgi:chaperone modulatory protein CbpM